MSNDSSKSSAPQPSRQKNHGERRLEGESEHPVYIIIGPPRSGTSALAGLLHRQGIVMYMAADVPDLDSPSGNQEDCLARIIDNHLMGFNGLGSVRDWDNPVYVDARDDEQTGLIKAYLRCRERHAGCRAWGVKDPRMCFLIEPWHEATKHLTVNWIHIYRENREAMIHSLLKMMPARLRFSGDPKALYRLASNWAENYHLACKLGFARTGLKPYRLTYEDLLTREGQERLASEFAFQRPISGIRPSFNRSGDVTRGYQKLFLRFNRPSAGER
jgi:hypothetical protein